jgi:hypothetical protein
MSSISLKNVGIFRDEYHAMVATVRRAPLFGSTAFIERCASSAPTTDRQTG